MVTKSSSQPGILSAMTLASGTTVEFARTRYDIEISIDTRGGA